MAIGKHTAKFDPTSARAKCPRYEQIRYLAVFSLGAKGPVVSKSMHRKLLGNEEYCLQIDPHSTLSENWDDKLKKEYLSTKNEFAIISTTPQPMERQSEYDAGGSKSTEVVRRCHLEFAPSGIPWFTLPDGMAENLEEPLLSHSWNAGFSFSKCHLHESTPYDCFLPQIFDTEEFPHFVRFWTRGYDVYTPTQNIVFHMNKKYGEYDSKGFRKNERERKESLTRIKTLLQLPGGDNDEAAMGNLGVYGLGRRRTLSQLEAFCGIDLGGRNTAEVPHCGKQEWVPYDLAVGPMENFYHGKGDGVDPNPIFPLRTVLNQIPKVLTKEDEGRNLETDATDQGAAPFKTLLILWILGGFIWYSVFIKGTKTGGTRKKNKKHFDSTKDK